MIDPAKFPKFLSPKKLRQSENEQGRRRRGWEAAAARRGQGEQGGGARAALALAGRGAALERAARARSVGPLRLPCLALLNGASLATGGTPGTPRTFLPVLGPLPTVWDDGHVWNDGWHAVRLPAAAECTGGAPLGKCKRRACSTNVWSIQHAHLPWCACRISRPARTRKSCCCSGSASSTSWVPNTGTGGPLALCAGTGG